MKRLETIKEYVDLRLFILIAGLIFVLPVTILKIYFAENALAYNLPFPVWLAFLSGTLSIGCFVTFVVFYFKEINRFNLITFSIAFILIVSNIITTLIEPETIISHIYSFRLVYYVDVATTISISAKVTYIFMFTLLVLYIHAGVFFIPQMIKKIEVMKYLVYLLLLGVVVSITYSLITEFSKYGEFIKQIFSFEANPVSLSENAILSFFPHKNTYALALIIVLIGTTFNFTITKNKIYPVISVLLATYIFFTYSKSCIILSWAYLLLFFYVYMIITFKDNKRNKTIFLSAVSLLVVILFIITITLFFNNDGFHKMMENVFNDFGTFSTRKLVWKNVMEIITPQWLVTGRGYGIVETILPEVTYLSVVERLPHEHSWFYSMLAKGGILLLVCFIALLLYVCFVSYQACRKEPLISIPLIGGELLFFIQSFIENNYYLIFVFCAVLGVIGCLYNKDVKSSEKN